MAEKVQMNPYYIFSDEFRSEKCKMIQLEKKWKIKDRLAGKLSDIKLYHHSSCINKLATYKAWDDSDWRIYVNKLILFLEDFHIHIKPLSKS